MHQCFVLPNWVFFFAQHVSLAEVALIDGIAKFIAIFLEIPSGTIADYCGRKKTIILGNVFFILACLMILSADNFNALLMANILVFFGFAFVSGAKEALLYDSLLEGKKIEHYNEILGKTQSLSIVVTISTVFIGGFLYGINENLPFFSWILFSFLAIITLMFMDEPKSIKNDDIKYYITLKNGVVAVFNKPFFTFVLPVLFFSMLDKMQVGIIRQSL